MYSLEDVNKCRDVIIRILRGTQREGIENVLAYMDENGFYSDIISSSAVCTIMCDSIQFDEHERKFTYYGTQLIKRRTRDLKRSMVTTGYIESVPRTRNNPHGLMITNWRTLENKDLDY